MTSIQGASYEADLIALLSDLVAIESVNSSLPGGGAGEREIAEYVKEYCAGLGVEVDLTEVLPNRPNVLAQLRPSGARRTILLESHLDTMTLSPMGDRALKPEIRDGRLYGRGSCDTKGSLAAMMQTLKLLSFEDSLGVNVLLLGTVDEEAGFGGVVAAARAGLRADGAVIGEPTDLEVVVAHKGVVRWRFRTIGRAAHSAHPEEGDNAIYQMVEVIEWLRHEVEPRLSSVSHALVGNPTISIGRIWGGVAVNVVPDSCVVEVDRRTIPGERSADVLKELDQALAVFQATHPEIKVEREAPFLDAPSLDTPLDAPVVRAALAAREAVMGSAKPIGVTYGTNASPLAEIGRIDGVVLGPGSITRAHTGDEYVPLAEVVSAVQIYGEIVHRFAQI